MDSTSAPASALTVYEKMKESGPDDLVEYINHYVFNTLPKTKLTYTDNNIKLKKILEKICKFKVYDVNSRNLRTNKLVNLFKITNKLIREYRNTYDIYILLFSLREFNGWLRGTGNANSENLGKLTRIYVDILKLIFFSNENQGKKLLQQLTNQQMTKLFKLLHPGFFKTTIGIIYRDSEDWPEKTTIDKIHNFYLTSFFNFLSNRKHDPYYLSFNNFADIINLIISSNRIGLNILKNLKKTDIDKIYFKFVGFFILEICNFIYDIIQ